MRPLAKHLRQFHTNLFKPSNFLSLKFLQTVKNQKPINIKCFCGGDYSKISQTRFSGVKSIINWSDLFLLWKYNDESTHFLCSNKFHNIPFSREPSKKQFQNIFWTSLNCLYDLIYVPSSWPQAMRSFSTFFCSPVTFAI